MTDDLKLLKWQCQACKEAGVPLTVAPDYVLQLLARIEQLQSGLTAIEARWREASQDKCFRSHFRQTMSECADELRGLLAGFDDSEVQAEIDKAFAGGEL